MANRATLSDSLNSALTLSVSDVLTDLGGIPVERLLAGASPTVPAQANPGPTVSFSSSLRWTAGRAVAVAGPGY